ncbi:hypothetical protein [Tateyamaria omphalii]|uniref:hypothetical protein n=1 Tax=Tateyamaria omphalii TaxID=299262 RepID=UPI00167ACE62|nr:hypothetical protein [Tateyamaria omphalii]
MNAGLKNLVPALLACACATGALAQSVPSWTAKIEDLGANIYASAAHGGGTMTITCTAPSPQGRDPLESYENELHQTGPYEVYVRMYDPYFDWSGGSVQTGATIFLGQTGYRLPPFELDEFSGTIVRLSMVDPLMQALTVAPGFILDTGQGQAFDFGVSGLAGALDQVLYVCVSRWGELGRPVPAALGRYATTAPTVAGAVAATRNGIAQNPDRIPLRRQQPQDGPAIVFVPPVLPIQPGQSMYDRAVGAANSVCSTARLNEGALWPGDLEGDGAEDIVMNWGFVECLGPNGTVHGVPGACDSAGQCRVTVFSSAQTARGLSEWIGQAYHAEPDPNGPAPLFMNTRTGVCGTSAGAFGCSAWLAWSGSGFSRVQARPLDADPGAVARAQVAVADTPTQDLPIQFAPAPRLPIPNAPPAAADAHIRKLCQGPFSFVDPSALQASDIDGDGLADFLLNWTGVSCNGGVQGRAFCGAANCRIDVFLSSRGYATPEDLLGTAADFVKDASGRVGVLLAGTAFVCADGFCDTPWYWNGAELAQ